MQWSELLFSVFTVFLHWFGVMLAYWLAKKFVTGATLDTTRPTVYTQVVAYCAVVIACVLISGISAVSLGTHTEGGDYFRDPGEVVVDFEASDTERLSHGLNFLFIILPASLVGAFNAIYRIKKLSDKDRQDAYFEQERRMKQM